VGYTVAQAARLSGCTPSQLRHWARRSLVAPTGADGRYQFRDLVALRMVRSLLDAGLPSVRVGLAVRALDAAGDDLAGLRLVTDGATVWACHDDGQILDALRSGQLALFVSVERVAADVDAEVRDFDRERAEFVSGLQNTRTGARSQPRAGSVGGGP
jgi:DNA-binding transcriptional MerR regulator